MLAHGMPPHELFFRIALFLWPFGLAFVFFVLGFVLWHRKRVLSIIVHFLAVIFLFAGCFIIWNDHPDRHYGLDDLPWNERPTKDAPQP